MIVGTVKKIHRRKRFSVISKKRAPALGWLGISRSSEIVSQEAPVVSFGMSKIPVLRRSRKVQ